jgi:hypothetical protein
MGGPGMVGGPAGNPGLAGGGGMGSMYGPGRSGGAGMPGSGGAPGPGNMYGRGGAGMPGTMGSGGSGPGMGLGMGPGAGAPAAGSEEFDTFDSIVMAVIELDDPKRHVNEALSSGAGTAMPTYVAQYKTKYGQVALYNDDETLQSFIVPAATPKARFLNHRRNLAKTADAFLYEAEWALAHGLIKECEELIAEAAQLPDPSAQAKEKLAACAKAKAMLEKPFEGTEGMTVWRERLPGFAVATSEKGHYAIFYTGAGQGVPHEVKHLGDLLEHQMKGLCLWFALRGKPLSLPDDKLVAVQVDNESSFRAQRALLDLPGMSEGFYAPRDNIAVFSSHRLDEGYVTFSSQMKSYWSEGWNRDELLKGKTLGNLRSAAKKANMNMNEFLKREFPKMQTMALLEKALEDEAELAAVSHEGTRQLATAAGFFARNVVLPEWVSSGFASLFETPKGPFAGADGTAQVAFWPSFGAPSWAYLRQFQNWAKSKDEFVKLDAAPDALRRTVTDAYFHKARLPQDLQIDQNLSRTERERREKEIARAKESTFRANALSWSLNYYLAKHRLADYVTYLNDLRNLPRDLELDDQTLLVTFARSFKLTNAAGDAVDEGKFSALANDWFKEMAKEETPGKDIKLPAPKRDTAPGNGRPGGGGNNDGRSPN